MNFPNLPTDNLYKFVALAGLVMLFLSVLFPVRWLLEIQQKQADLGAELLTLEDEAKYFSDSIQKAESQLAQMSKKAAEQKREQIERSRRELRSKLHVLKAKHQQIDTLITLGREFRSLVSAGMFIGLGLAFGGFSLWYRRVQRLQDSLLRRQVEQVPTDRPQGT